MPAAKRGQRRATAKSAREAPAALETEEVEIELEGLDTFNESINIMVYGPSGHGKTTLVGGAPNATFVSTEKGVVAAKRSGSKAKLLRAPNWQKAVAAKRYADANFGADDWVIWDSLTKMQVLMIRWILEQINEGNSARDLDIPAIQDHQKWQNYFKRFVDQLIDAPYNCIFVCTDMFRDDEDGENIVLPALTGKDYEICNYVRAQMDVVLYYRVTTNKAGEEIRRALAQPFAPYVAAKDRYDALGRFWDIPEGYYGAMGDMIAAIQGEEQDYDEEEED